MNYIAMLDRLEWSFQNGRSDVDKLDRILLLLRRSADVQALENFWDYVVQHNVFIGALLLNKASRIYGKEDTAVALGEQVLQAYLQLDAAKKDEWYLLSLLELEQMQLLDAYFHNKSSNENLAAKLRALSYCSNPSQSVIALLYVVSDARPIVRKRIFDVLRDLKLVLDAALVTGKELFSHVIGCMIETSELNGLYSLLTLYGDLKYSQFCDISPEQWRDYLLAQPQPYGMILFREIMMGEKLPIKDLMQLLFCFTSYSTGKRDLLLNDYLFFSNVVCTIPEQYDYFAPMFAPVQADVDLYALLEQVQDVSPRFYNYLVMEKPFRRLVQFNPDKVTDYLRMIGPLSLYYYSEKRPFKKNKAWVNANGNYKSAYLAYFQQIAQRYPAQDVMWIYMNSPLKSHLDCSYVIRTLFQSQDNTVNLSRALNDYTFYGKIYRNKDADIEKAWRVTLSNASCYYRYPIYHRWTAAHAQELEENYKDGDIVSFKIMGVTAKGMIFVHNIRQTSYVTD